ncbi:hypothetical protein, partial [Pseudomonas sp. SID14000]|uniref:hypothetical protein n=1 Tax=Pseudomonas sp. SID14000 TaxID=1986221 RepID=UPI00148382E0
GRDRRGVGQSLLHHVGCRPHTARLHAPKTRKHTRHWEPDGDTDLRRGDELIDSARVVGAGRWEEEAANTLTPSLQQAAATAARALSTSMVGTPTVPPGVVAAALVATNMAGHAVAGLLSELAVALDAA